MVMTINRRTNVTYVLFGFSVLLSFSFFFASSHWPEESFLVYSYMVMALFLGTALLTQLRFRQLRFLNIMSIGFLLFPSILVLL